MFGVCVSLETQVVNSDSGFTSFYLWTKCLLALNSHIKAFENLGWRLQTLTDERQIMFGRSQNLIIACFSCLHMEFWCILLFSQRWLKNWNMNFKCYSNLHVSLRDCRVCQIRFGDVLWSYCEDKLTVLKIMVFSSICAFFPHGY